MVKLNRRVRVRAVSAVQNDQGGNVLVDTNNWPKWAQVEDRSGNTSFPYQQQVWVYDYKITMRYEESRPTKSNYQLLYESQVLEIKSITIVKENFKQYEVCRCAKIDIAIT